MALTIDELNIQIVAESTSATKALEALISRLESLQSKLGGVGTAGKKTGDGIKKTGDSAKTAEKGLKGFVTQVANGQKPMQKFTDNLTRQISKYRTLTGAFKSVAKVFANWFNESNEYIETLNLFNVTMGESADAAYEYAEKVQTLIGIDMADWMQYQGVFKNLTAGFGVASEDADVMSKNLTQLSYDMASFFNTDVETAFDKLSSAMSGQVKGLREFGIDTTVASLQEYALSKGIDASVRSMTQAEKSMLRYNYIMEKSIIMQGDMARTIVTPANAMRVLGSQMDRMKRAFGNIISVLVTQFIPYIQLVVEAIASAANALASFFGFELPEIDYSGLSTSFEDSEESLDDVEDSIKEIKKQLMGFDELNIIQNPASSSGGTDLSGLLTDMEPLDYDFLENIDTSRLDEVKKKLKEIWKTLKPILTLVTAIFAVAKITKWVAAFGGGVATISAALYASNIGFAFLAWAGGAATFSEAIGFLSAKLTMMQKIVLGVATVIAEFLVIFTLVKDLVTDINNGTATTGQIITTIIAGIAAIGVAWLALSVVFNSTAIGAIVTAVVALVAAIGGVVSSLADAGAEAYRSSEDFQIMSTIIEESNDRISRCDEALQNMKDSIYNLDKVSYDYAIAKNLTNEIFDLNEKANLSSYELAQIKQKVEVLNGLNIEGLHLAIDETTGRVVQTRKETEQLIATLEKEAKLEALRDIMVEAYRDQYQAEVDLKNSANDVNAAKEALLKTQRELEELAEGGVWLNEIGKYWELMEAVDSQTEALEKAVEAQKKSNETLEKAKDNLAFASEEYGKISTAQDGFVDSTGKVNTALEEASKGSYKSAGDIVSGAAKGITDNTSQFTTAVEGMATDGNKAFANTIDAHSPAKVYVEYGENMVQGLVNGVSSYKSKATESVKSLAQSMNTVFSDTLKATFGKNTTLESELTKILEKAKNTFNKATWTTLIKGVTDAINGVSTSGFTKALDGLLTKAKSVFSSSLWEGYAKNITNALAKIKVPTFKSIGLSITFSTNVSADKSKVYEALGLSGWPSLYWYTYAQGGFPDVGEMFIAREAGPELVGSIGKKTAVANNDQIISGIESGVYRAMVAANSTGNGGTQTIRIINEIDGDVVGEKVIKYHNGKVMQTGVSPLLV